MRDGSPSGAGSMTTGAVIVVEGVSAAGTSVGAASSAGSELHAASAMQRLRIPIVRVFISRVPYSTALRITNLGGAQLQRPLAVIFYLGSRPVLFKRFDGGDSRRFAGVAFRREHDLRVVFEPNAKLAFFVFMYLELMCHISLLQISLR
jgi:hypothetical protein